MKVHRGDYEGASRFAYFDKPVQDMNLEECRGLLMAILHRAMPGEDNAELVYKELAIAEQCCKEQEPMPNEHLLTPCKTNYLP